MCFKNRYRGKNNKNKTKPKNKIFYCLSETITNRWKINQVNKFYNINIINPKPEFTIQSSRTESLMFLRKLIVEKE